MEQTLLDFINTELISVYEQLAVEGISHGQRSYLMGQIQELLKMLKFLVRKEVGQ